MKKILTIFIGFLHDLAAGCWAATLLAVYYVERVSLKNPALRPELAGLKKDLFYIGILCICMVLLSGTGRAFTYVGNVDGENAEKLKRRMLIIKHILLFLVFGVGIYWQYKMVYG